MTVTKEFRRLVRFAISEEQKAQRLYRDMVEKAKDPYIKAILEGLYEQELLHEEKLRSLLASVEPETV